MPRRRRPADQRWKGAGRAADHDVLRRPALQPDGVDQDVEQDRDGQDRRSGEIDREIHQDDREGGEADAEVQRRLAVHPAIGQGALLRAAHLGVEVRLVPLVERTGRARAERDAQDRGEADDGVDGVSVDRGRREHPAQAGEHDERHHPRLGEREEVAPVGWRQKGRRGGHDRPGYTRRGTVGKGRGGDRADPGQATRRAPER